MHRVLQDRVLRKKFWPEREEVIKKCTELHKEDLHDFYPSPNIIPVMKLR
jgi:hypothetical protein